MKIKTRHPHTTLVALTFLSSVAFSETPAPETSAPSVTPAIPIKAKAPEPPTSIDCQYKLPKDTKTVDQATLSTWAENAAIQSFHFNAEKIKAELDTLKNCYTKQGWRAFNDAMEASGNLKAIETHALSVTSSVSGQTSIENTKENQWKAAVPLKVIYQNKDKQLLQSLDVSLLIALDNSGSLGIMQIIAVPQKTA